MICKKMGSYLLCPVIALFLNAGFDSGGSAADFDGAPPPMGAYQLEAVGAVAAYQELERGATIYTFGDPAELRSQLGIPTYSVSDPGPLLGYAIRRLPNGRYAVIYP
ncbi:MAG: hypothetical protein KJ970_00685 [Candidatus Eisenbacteria bacterium]|uniref:Uncharacterized protein n=1 Tax=Eiseniibacteriota bacterium TaxID=2212470 RepID=A0A948RSX5_UNCEI|nr:hypothetical protein [Candidatus Eisenbacteria bacterium]MBU1949775.1 hypothetical protein [Candidatus Eisenbacteria bacterium]MBU2689416.1 hypothetical protein [Candidatus Eisenbacteria bacterium]